ncbi:hypothetical protein FACS1894177_03550 [Bacteroidia bacterium]|nr:hypothetical protein FACS1894177_03550 [Bacteroidia bacterium]
MLQIDSIIKEQGVEITELAKRLGVSRQTVHYYIRQGNKNSIETLDKIALAIDIQTSDFFEQTNNGKIVCPHCGHELSVKIE